ncbi:MAG: cytochrome c [Bacteroidetes bacterium]|nr:cytochrome c [Bacteroidota bacterium]
MNWPLARPWWVVFRVGMATSVMCFFSCSSHDTKFQQYFSQGQSLYEKHCSNCHQKNGEGLKRLYPPLANSDFFKKNLPASICIMKYGIAGEMEVNGVKFNKPMPGVPSLTELELAEIATYIANAWGSEDSRITIEQVTEALKNCKTP